MFDFKQNADFDIIGMGEVMLRLSPPQKETISGSDTFIKNAGGSELNVVSDAAMLGARGGIITKLPDSKTGRFVRDKIRSGNVSDDYIIFDKSPEKRLGIYYYECGAYPRKSSVEYDRRFSSMCSLNMNELKKDVFEKTRIFHISSIALAINSGLCDVVFEMLKLFKSRGAKISFDVNYRSALWSEKEAKIMVEKVLPMVDFLFVSEETSRRMLQRSGTLEDIMKGYADEYSCTLVATTQRKVISPDRHDFSSVIYCGGDFYKEMPYKSIEVIDRVGSGDAYVAGVLFGLIKFGCPQKALETGNALSSLKNTVAGDMAGFSYDEVLRVVDSHKSAGAGSEMER